MWTDQTTIFAFGATLTGSSMQVLRENMTAITNGDSGAPKLESAGMYTPHVFQFTPFYALLTSSSNLVELPDLRYNKGDGNDTKIGFSGRGIITDTFTTGIGNPILKLYAQATLDYGSTWLISSEVYYGESFSHFSYNSGAFIGTLKNDVSTSQLPYNITGEIDFSPNETRIRTLIKYYNDPSSLTVSHTGATSAGFTIDGDAVTGIRFVLSNGHFIAGEFFTFRTLDRESAV